MNKLRRIFYPTREEQLEDLKKYKTIHDELKVKKGCSTCIHCIHIRDFPDFVTGEECVCAVGLACDTVLFLVEQCPKWEDSWNVKTNKWGGILAEFGLEVD